MRPYLCWCWAAIALPGLADTVRGQSAQDTAALDRFAKLTAHERRQLVDRAEVKAIWHTVAKGEIIPQLVERGTLEAVQVSDVSCRVKSGEIIIKWVADDGTIVKRGDKILEFDDRFLRDKIREQRLPVELAQAMQEQATRSLALVEREGKLAVREAHADVTTAELELKADAGADALKKELLELRVERARVGVEKARLTATKQRFRAEAELREKTAALQQEQARLRALEEDLQNCTVMAPQDGLLVYYVPPQRANRLPNNEQQTLVAQGEPVRTGQKLLRVADLRRMAVALRVPEGKISRVRKDMSASVRVDAFPNVSLTGVVASVATVASQADWQARDVKVYPVLIRLDGENQRLKPGMSAEARVVFERRQGVLWLPAVAVVGKGKERYCYVRDGQDKLELRNLALGVQGDQTVEIREGLREGDQVLLNVREVSQHADMK